MRDCARRMWCGKHVGVHGGCEKGRVVDRMGSYAERVGWNGRGEGLKIVIWTANAISVSFGSGGGWCFKSPLEMRSARAKIGNFYMIQYCGYVEQTCRYVYFL